MTSKRNYYIDVIKFIFAIIIAEFHLGTGWFPGGRVAVEGFFMITGFLMMKSIERDKHPLEGSGIATARFLGHKYMALFPILLPSAVIAFVLSSIGNNHDVLTALDRLPLLIFDVFPLRTAGFKGVYVVGISWYLSSMFLALAILYPFCRKYKSNFTLVACPLAIFFFYGVLSHFYGHIAVGPEFLEEKMVNAGVLRALAGCSAGCLLYEIGKRLANKQVTCVGRIVFTVVELCGFAYFFYAMHEHSASSYDYVLVGVLFGLLLIGICGLSYSSYLLRAKWLRALGTASTLIVLNHYRQNVYLKSLLGKGYAKTDKVWHFVCAVIVSCIVAYLFSLLVKLIVKGIGKIKFFKSENASADFQESQEQ